MTQKIQQSNNQMNHVFNKPCSVKPSKEVLIYLRIYIVNYLVSQFAIEHFTRDSIDLIANFIFRYISFFILQMKWTCSIQGKTMPNFLHLFSIFLRNNMTLDDFIKYLKSRFNKDKKRKSDQVIAKYQTKRLIQRTNSCSIEIPYPCHQNIISMPFNYHQQLLQKNNSLPLYQTISEFVQKPPQFTYKVHEFFINRVEDQKDIARRSAQQEIGMKKMLNKQKLLNDNKILRIGNQPSKRSSENTLKFDMIKYL